MRPLRHASTSSHPALFLAITLALASSVGAANQPDAGSTSRDSVQAFESARMIVDPATGNPRLVRLSKALPVSEGATTRDTALRLLKAQATVFGLENPVQDLQWIRNQPDLTGGEQAIFSQTYHGLPVFGSLVRVHFDSEGAIKTVNGTIVSDIAVDPVPRYDAHLMETAALTIVAKDTGFDPGTLSISPAELLIYRTGLVRGLPGTNHLTWEVQVKKSPNLHEVLYLDAHDGQLIDRRSEIHNIRRTIHVGHYPNVIWSEGDTLPYTSGNGTRDAEINELIAATGDAHALMANLTGGDYLSFDGEDATMNAVYDSDSLDCPNAVESGGLTGFCEGMVSDDVAAHEWVHAYTEWTHSLIYQWQPGALNEAYSDIFGELTDQLNGRGTDTPGGIRTAANCSTAGGSPQPSLEINSPASVADAYPVGGAVFNPIAPWVINAPVELVDDGSGTPSDACESIIGFTPGSMALVDRGSCYFRDKVLAAQAAGAVGVIVVNNQGDDILEMGGDLPRLAIPAVLVGQSIGETLKAVLAEGVEATLSLDGNTIDSVRWIVGEDTKALGALRDMWSPSCFGDPDRVRSVNYYCGEEDNGGVHTNSGVPNRAFALLVDGGEFNDHHVSPIDAAKAARIYWRAMSRYQTPVTGFSAHAELLEISCQDLIGQQLFDLSTGMHSGQVITADDCNQVSIAMDAVEMRSPPDQCDYAQLLEPDEPPVDGNVIVFAETFDEEPAGSWRLTNHGVYSEYEPRDWVWTDSPPEGASGGAFFAVDSVLIGDCQPGSDDQSGVMELTSPSIEIPHGTVSPTLVFDHWMASELLWDGGNLKLSINGSAFFQVPLDFFLHNGYNVRINHGNTNPLAGEWAWTGTNEGTMSGSWGQTQIDLSLLVEAGDTLAIRFDLGVDGCNGAEGWYVDNVRIVAKGGSARRGLGRVTP